MFHLVMKTTLFNIVGDLFSKPWVSFCSVSTSFGVS